MFPIALGGLDIRLATLLCYIYFPLFTVDLSKNGLTIVKGVPPDGLPELVNSVGGFHKPTHYGVDFQVTQRFENLNNLAYSSKSLGLHLDLPFYKYKPGVSCRGSGGRF